MTRTQTVEKTFPYFEQIVMGKPQTVVGSVWFGKSPESLDFYSYVWVGNLIGIIALVRK